MKTNFKITNITCDACIKLSAMSLKKIPSVKNVEIKSDGSAMIESDKEIAKEEIENALSKVDKKALFE
jgi:copper chaperone CopZ